MNKPRFVDKVAIVTGGGSGMGQAFCYGLAAEGASVVCADINFDSALATVAEIKVKGGKAIAIKADITKAAQIQRMVDKTLDVFAGVDVLINNAGIGVRQSLLDTTEEVWDRVVNTNLKGAFLVTKAAIPHMMEKKYGKIINIASLAGTVGLVSTHYTAAKAGLIGMTRLWAGEFASYHINVNAIAPGFIATPLNAKVRKTRVGKSMGERIPFGWGSTDSVVPLVLFLSSKESDYITGQTIIVDGGLSCFVDMGPEYRDFNKGIK